MNSAMPNHPSTAIEILRAEIAAAAARMIAEDGSDYGTAKRKAAKQILGDSKTRGDYLPENAEIEEEVRQYNALFFGDRQPQRLKHLRELAAEMMQELACFTPYLTGAVLNGTAGEHSDIHLQLFADSPKDVEIYLLNKGINFEVSETTHFKRRNQLVETISFFWKKEIMHLALYQLDDLRGALNTKSSARVERAKVDAVLKLLAEPHSI